MQFPCYSLSMNMFLIASFIFFVAATSSAHQIRSVEAYYWRDFYGLIPSNAIKAGKDENGADTFIGQMSTVAEYNPGKAPIHTVPGTLKKGFDYVFAPYAGRVIRSNDTSNTKILCYDSESRYKWYSLNILYPSSCRYVIAGNEDGFPLFVGRASHNKEVVIGKIFSDNTNHVKGLIAAYNGVEKLFNENYEVLTHCA